MGPHRDDLLRISIASYTEREVRLEVPAALRDLHVDEGT
jgi:hypothetical protein